MLRMVEVGVEFGYTSEKVLGRFGGPQPEKDGSYALDYIGVDPYGFQSLEAT